MFHFRQAEFPPICCSRFINYCLTNSTKELNWGAVPQPLEDHQLPLSAFPWPFALGGHKDPGTSAVGQAGERCGLRTPSTALCCSAQKLGRKSQWTGQWWNWWNIRAISHDTPSRRGTERLEETIQRQQKSFCCLQNISFSQWPPTLCLEPSWHPAPSKVWGLCLASLTDRGLDFSIPCGCRGRGISRCKNYLQHRTDIG